MKLIVKKWEDDTSQSKRPTLLVPVLPLVQSWEDRHLLNPRDVRLFTYAIFHTKRLRNKYSKHSSYVVERLLREGYVWCVVKVKGLDMLNIRMKREHCWRYKSTKGIKTIWIDSVETSCVCRLQ